MSSPVKVVVSGAAGQIGYQLIPLIATGQVFGDRQVELRLLDIERALKPLGGVAMEIQDGAYPKVDKVVCTSDYETAFRDADFAILVGGFPRMKGMVRADLLLKNKDIFVGQGKAIDQFASKQIKVLVVANPANTNALVLAENAPSIPRENITALTRLDHNRALGQLAAKTNTPLRKVKNIAIWGNHSKTQVPDATFATADGKAVPSLVPGEWLSGEFTTTVQQRGAAIIAARGLSSAMSAANAAKDHVRDWISGTPAGVWTSMGVYSDGSKYGVAKDLIYSFPVTCKDGKWEIVEGLALTAETQKLMKVSEAELLDEKKIACQKAKL